MTLLSIDVDDADRRAVARFAEQRHLRFPILVDDGYVERAGVRVFPTTWFLDCAGRIAFTSQGGTEALAEEFAWRVDMLRQ